MRLKRGKIPSEKGSVSIETAAVLFIAFTAINSLGGLSQNLNHAANEITAATYLALGGGTEETMAHNQDYKDSTNSDGGGDHSSTP